MEKLTVKNKNVKIYNQDITAEYTESVLKNKIVAWDIETSGLDWKNDQIGTCQLYTPGEHIAIVTIENNPPQRLSMLLSNNSIKKVFHHAMFDLRFMSFHWKVMPENISCTKIASKISNSGLNQNQNLRWVLKNYLDITIKKPEKLAVSNWVSFLLSDEQVKYAVEDVIYLIRLLKKQEKILKAKKLLEFAYSCFAHIPTRIRLEICDYQDIYEY